MSIRIRCDKCGGEIKIGNCLQSTRTIPIGFEMHSYGNTNRTDIDLCAGCSKDYKKMKKEHEDSFPLEIQRWLMRDN